MAVKHLVADEEIFLANYSDGLTDAPLPDMIERFQEAARRSAVSSRFGRPSIFTLPNLTSKDAVRNVSHRADQSEVWINGGYFIFRK